MKFNKRGKVFMCSNELYETVGDYAKTKGVSVKYFVRTGKTL
jgi:hypothetical protein